MNMMNTDKPVSLYQRVVTYLILTLFTVQPALANVVVSGSGNTSVETAANGVEVVNIATPNSKGLSHNKYQKFNVDPSGLVLNNSTEQFKRSELAGILQNNANLNSSGSASVILNEVTGANRSQLKGYTEVLGQSANVILTNPYGITCDGCGFINTPRVTLSTGAAQIQNGEVSGFEVAEGTVTVQGLGLDASRQSYFDIIARTAEINAQINANQLNVITGKNRVDYQSNAVTKRASDDNRPALAIDSSSLGGMYAGRISLVATEEGVGVNVGNLAASQGNLTITADGKITLADASATQNIELVTKNDLALSGTHSAGNDLSVSATQVTATDSKSVAGGTLSLSAQSATITNASLEAGTLTSNTAQVTLDNQSSLKSQTANLSGLASLNNDGMVSASNALSVTGNQVTLSGGGSVEANQVNLTSDSLELDTTLRAQNLTIDSQGALNLSNQSKVSASDTANLTAQNLSHNGELSTTNALSMKASHTISNTGNTQAGSMNIEAASISNTGMLAANQAMALNADNVTLAGEVGAADITVTSKQLAINGAVSATGQSTLTANNSLTVSTGAKVMSGNAMTINTTNLTSQGVVQSNDSLSVTANTGNVQGTLTSQKAMILSGDTLEQSGTLYSGGDLTLTQTDSVSLKGNVDVKGAVNINTDALGSQTRLVTDKSLTVTAGNITNSGLLSATQALTINADTLNQSGDMLTEDNLSINARQVTLGGNTAADKVLSVQSTDSITTSASASVYGATGVDMGTVSLIQQGSMLSYGENLSLTATTLTNIGKISADGQTNITVSGKLSNQSAGMISGQSTALQAGSVTNHGRLQALDALGLSASSLTNYGAVVAQGDVTTNLTGTLTNRGVIYAGNHGYLHANALNNYSDILTQKNLTIARNSSNARSSSLLNSSGTIESLGGDINIYADTVKNKRTKVSIQSTSQNMTSSSTLSGGASSFLMENDSVHAPEYRVYENCIMNCGGRGREGTAYRISVKGGDTYSYSELVRRDSQVLRSASSASRIVASSNVSITGQTVTNEASQISGSAVSITASTLTNAGYQLSSENVYYDYKLDPESYKYRWYYLNPEKEGFKFLFNRTGVRSVGSGVTEALNSSITATGKVTLNVTNKVNNSTIKSNASKVAPTGNRETNQSISAASGNVDAAEVVAIGETAITLPAFNTVPYPDYRLPTGPNSLFIYTTEPKSRYLIETNPLLTDLGSYLGSDYFQDKVGISTGEDVTFLGDAFYDTRVITQAIFEQTGKRYLSKNIGSDLSQMQSLMDAAAKEKTSLDLTVGVSLTQQQVAQLNSDIIWYEQIEVNGQQVLAPKLYLAQVSQENVSNGALIAGSNVTVQGGDIENSGQILAGSTLSLTSDGKITNDTGSLKAGGDATLKAEGDITNISGTISGDKVSLVSTNGSVVNETLTEQLNVDKDGNLVEAGASNITQITTNVGNTATIASKGKLTISAGDSITVIGGEIKSVDETDIQAGKDLTIASLKDVEYTHYQTRRATIEKEQTDYKDSTITSGGGLNIKTGNNLTASGGAITATADLSMDVGGDLTTLANQTSTLDRYDASYKKDIIRQTRQEGTTLSAGGNLSVSSGGDTTLVAAELKSNKDVTVSAGGQMVAMAADETDYSRTYRKSKSFFGSSVSDTEISSTTAKGTAFSGNNVTLVSGNTQLHQASELTAQNDIHLESKNGALIFKAAEESESYRHETKKSGVMVKMQGEGHTSTTQKQTTMQSGGDISIASALGMEVDYVSTDNTLGKALAQIQANDELAWMAQLKDNPDVNWNEVNEAFDSWSYSESSLSGPAAAIIAIAVAVATSGTGVAAVVGNGVAGAVGGGSVTAAAAGAATSSLITQASISFINNGGDIGATLKELGSSEKMKVLATAALTAGALSQYATLTNGAGVDQTTLASGNPNYITPTPDFSLGSIANHVEESVIRAGIDSGINGTDFEDSFTNSLRGAIANDIGAIAANKIGDLGLTYNLDNGSITKTTLHGISQGVVAELAGGEFEAGMAAGIATELTGDLIGNIEDRNTQVGVAGLIGATAGVIATGDAEGAYTGQSAGQTVHQFNHLNHTEAKELIDAERNCNNNNEACDRANELRALDAQRNLELLAACNGSNASQCEQLTQFAKDNFNTYTEATLELLQGAGIYSYQMQTELQEHFYNAEQISNDPTGQKAETVDAVMSGLIDLMPVVGDAKGFYEAETGIDYLLAATALVPVIGDLVKKAGKALDSGDIELAQDFLEQAQKQLRDEPKLLEYKPELNVDVEIVPDEVDVIDIASGCKGDWCKALNKPEPNKTFKVDDNYSFSTDELGRTKSVSGKLDLSTKDRNKYQQSKAGKSGENGDEGGHLIASIFNGPGEKINLVPMNGNLNKGEWKKLENSWAEKLREGKSIDVTVEPVYSSSSVRPDSFNITYTVDGGRPIEQLFLNTPGGK